MNLIKHTLTVLNVNAAADDEQVSRVGAVVALVLGPGAVRRAVAARARAPQQQPQQQPRRLGPLRPHRPRSVRTSLFIFSSGSKNELATRLIRVPICSVVGAKLIN